MKKWMYLISVSLMLAVFLALYFTESKKIHQREQTAIAKAIETKRAEDAKKLDAETKARADAEKRAAERAAADAKVEAEKVARWEEDSRKIQEATDKYNSEANVSSKRAAELEVQLSALRASKEKLNREAFEISKRVEMGKVDRRTAELEIQRTVEMISRKAQESSMTKMPPAPAPVPAS